MQSPAVIDREQAQLQARVLGVDSAQVCDDVENAIGDILCDAFDELEGVLGAEPTVPLDGEQIREVRRYCLRLYSICSGSSIPHEARDTALTKQCVH